MRRRKNAKTRFREEMLNTFQSRVVAKLKNRHMLLCPFPLDPLYLYRTLWGDDQWKGLDALNNVDGLLQKNSEMHLRFFWDEAQTNEVHIKVTLPEPMPMGEGDWDEIDYYALPEEEQAMVRSWAVDWRKYQADTDRVEAALGSVVKASSTIGQVVRLWPDLIGFMRPHQQDEVNARAQRSPYPRDALEWEYFQGQDAKQVLKEHFRPEYFQSLHDVIAEALMLPEYDDLRHVATHAWEPPVE